MTSSRSDLKNLSKPAIELTQKELECLKKYHPLHYEVVRQCLLTGECKIVVTLAPKAVVLPS